MARLPVITSFISERFSAFNALLGSLSFQLSHHQSWRIFHQDKKQSLFVFLTVVLGYEY